VVRRLVILVLLVLWTGISAAPVRAQPGAVPAITERTRAEVATATARRATAASAKAALAQQYQAQLADVDRLKRQRASWRRDRQLRASLAASLDTAQALSGADRALGDADRALTQARRAALAAIDAELAAQPEPGRQRALIAARAAIGPAAAAPAKKIVLPDDALDPLADPEELDQQAAALRAGEDELAREGDRLARQATAWQRQAELRAQHDRAGDLAQRDDDAPRRTGGDGRNGASAQPEAGGAQPPGSPGTDAVGGTTFENSPEIVLADVLDRTAVDGLRKADQSSDPATKAQAASAAKEQVARRLARLRERRAAIEARARALRGDH
jgi:FtsZ-binding cell division protein ZapB